MHDALLRTKLFVPPVRPTLVRRPRLIERLNQGLQHEHKLTLISAPAGFGKTTLTADWVAGLQTDAAAAGSQGAHGVAWLSLDEDDNDVDRFLTYLVAALHQLEGVETAVGKGMLSMLRSARPPPSEDVLTALINSITHVPGRIILVLDDYHLINAQAVDDTLSFLLEHLPFQMHVVIATRSDPNLSLARLRARGQLTEIRAADLRFTAFEAADFLNRVMALDLAAADVAALEARTEGWIAGLQLAAISMRGHKDAAAFVRSFTGSHHFVLDYLVEEVLEHQPPSVQQFLLQTAVLQRLTGALCDALTGREDGHETLESLEQDNLFIIPLDDERRWYRYHHLFGELLRRRLRQAQPEREVVLHHLASEWYGNQGLADEAIEHATRAGDFQKAAQLIEQSADAMWGSGEHGKLRRWLAQLPEEALAARPYIAIFQASFECANGELDAAERTLTQVEAALDAGSTSNTRAGLQPQISPAPSDRARLQGRMAAVRSVVRSYQGDVPGILQYARQALELLPRDDSTWRGSTAVVLGNVHGFRGDMTAAYEARAEALSACKAAGDVYVAILANLQLAITLRAQGRLRQTIAICREQMAVAGDAGLAQSRTAGYLSAIWGETLAEMNDLDGALALAQRGFDLTERSGDLPMIGWSFMCLIRVLISRGDLADAAALLHRMEQIGRASNLPFWARDQMAAWQARLWLAQDQLAPAIH